LATLRFARALSLWILFAAGLLLSGCASGPASPYASSAAIAADGAIADRQILVMLSEQPVRHFQPGAAGGADYRSVKPPSRRAIERLGAEFGFRPVEDWWMPSLGVRCYLAEVRAGVEPEDVVARLSADPRVESAEIVRLFHAAGHTDPYYPMQSNAKLLKLDELHSVATGKGVLVAVIDTGIDSEHPDLEGQIVESENFVKTAGGAAPAVAPANEIHGTAVAGIIASKADNGVGIVGIAPSARLLALRACWQIEAKREAAQCSSFTLAQALQFALVRRPRIINLSLAGPRDRLLERLIDKALDQGIAVIAAVDPALAAGESFPATHPRVIAVQTTAGSNVAANAVTNPPTSAVTNPVTSTVTLAKVSSAAAARAATPIAAPGDRFLTTVPNGAWGFVSGSSFSTAEISGIAALLLEASPTLTPKEVGGLLAEYSPRTPASGDAAFTLNACAMLASVSKNHDCPCCTRLALPQPPDRRDRPS
jgi:hypothetical protein